ncbi:MAG: SDR family oxidoreductase [Mariprofundaceae bacterium]
MNVLITGGNRGLGLGFVQHYLVKGCQVWACYRDEKSELEKIDSDALHLIQWDVSTDDEPVGVLPNKVDLLINNAGIYGPSKGGQSLQSIRSQGMLEVFNVDCVGPLRVVQRLTEGLIAGQGVVANLSSKMGSSADNSSGGTYAYRAAKAALVIVSKSMAVDLSEQGVRVITLHPGWVRTDMTHHSGLIDVDVSVAGLTHVIQHVDDYEAGQFVAYDGSIVPY